MPSPDLSPAALRRYARDLRILDAGISIGGACEPAAEALEALATEKDSAPPSGGIHPLLAEMLQRIRFDEFDGEGTAADRHRATVAWCRAGCPIYTTEPPPPTEAPAPLSGGEREAALAMCTYLEDVLADTTSPGTRGTLERLTALWRGAEKPAPSGREPAPDPWSKRQVYNKAISDVLSVLNDSSVSPTISAYAFSKVAGLWQEEDRAAGGGRR